MAKVQYGGKWITAKVYRLPSQKTVYDYQKLYHHKTKTVELMWWQGEYPDGKLTDMISVPKAEFPHWQRRIDAGEAKPEAQLMSEWAERAARPADVAISYHNKIEAAGEWWQGNKIASGGK